jgi:hypothetical protein
VFMFIKGSKVNLIRIEIFDFYAKTSINCSLKKFNNNLAF